MNLHRQPKAQHALDHGLIHLITESNLLALHSEHWTTPTIFRCSYRPIHLDSPPEPQRSCWRS